MLITGSVTASNYMSRISASISSETLNTIHTWIKLFNQLQDNNSTLFIAGNGGSCSNSSHFSTDMSIGGLTHGIKFFTRSLCESNSNITAILNDIGPDEIFSTQLKAFAKPGDALLLVSASGNSQNLINCIDIAVEQKVTTLGLTGFENNNLDYLVSSSISLKAKIGEYGLVEDIHSSILHLLTYSFRLFKTDKKKYDDFLNLEQLSK
jgi:D-sedoheptulose 7-phosphate isomerase